MTTIRLILQWKIETVKGIARNEAGQNLEYLFGKDRKKKRNK